MKTLKEFMQYILQEELRQVKNPEGKTKWALVSKTTGKVLRYYEGEGKPSEKWVSDMERQIQYFKHMK